MGINRADSSVLFNTLILSKWRTQVINTLALKTAGPMKVHTNRNRIFHKAINIRATRPIYNKSNTNISSTSTKRILMVEVGTNREVTMRRSPEVANRRHHPRTFQKLTHKNLTEATNIIIRTSSILLNKTQLLIIINLNINTDSHNINSTLNLDLMLSSLSHSSN